MKTIITSEEINQVRAEHTKCPQFSSDNTHEAVIAEIIVSAKKSTLGVNYWTPQEIEKGQRTVFGELQFFVTKLYEL